MLKRITQALLAILMLVQVLIPTTTAFANGEQYEEYDAYDDPYAYEVEDEDILEVPVVVAEETEATEPEETENNLEAASEVQTRMVTVWDGIFVSTGNNRAIFEVGQEVTIRANSVPTGQRFASWSSLSEMTFADPTSTETTFIVPPGEYDISISRTTVPARLVQVINGTIVDGSSDNSFIEGEIVRIRANVPSGQRFIRWNISGGVGGPTAVANPTATETTFVMSGTHLTGAVTVTAVLETIPTRLVNVTNGTVVGGPANNRFEANQLVTVRANAVPAGQRFVGWTTTTAGITFANPTSTETTFRTPAGTLTTNINVTAVFEIIPTRLVNVTNGTVVGGPANRRFEANQLVTVRTNAAPARHRFVRWHTTTAGITFANATSTQTTFRVPAGTSIANINVTAIFEPIPTRIVRVTANHNHMIAPHLRHRNFITGDRVTLAAPAPRNGYRFVRWEGNVTITNRTNRTTASFRMPASGAVNVRAVYERRTAPNPRANRRQRMYLRNATAFRRGPGNSYHLQGSRARGTRATVLHNGRNGWRFVQIGNTRGWVRSNQLITPAANRRRIELENTRRTRSITFLRQRPNVAASGNLVGGSLSNSRVNSGARVVIVQRRTINRVEWVRVRAGNRTGWTLYISLRR